MVETEDSWYLGSFCGYCRFFGICSSNSRVEYGDEAYWEYMEG